MSIAIETTVTGDARARAASAIASLSPKQLESAVGPACQRHVQRHLRANGTNRRGWPTTNFWSRAAKATSWAPILGGVVVSVNQIGVRQRFYGGAIAPVKAGALTIPISPLSYGKTAADFPGLFKIRTKKGAYLVMYGYEGPKQAKGPGQAKFAARRATLIFLFKLSQGVDQEADPSVLPTMAELGETAVGAILEKFEQVKARNN